jgi:hypothetical protein
MGNNLHISYDLNNPGQDYGKLIDAIKNLGGWAKIHKSFWYVNSNFTAQEVVTKLWPLMDQNDTIYVVDATNNSAAWKNLNSDVQKYIQDNWLK